MDRRRFLLTSMAGALASPLAAEAQQAGRMPTVGVLSPIDRPSTLPYTEAFRRGLADHGYIEGQNIAVVYRWADGRADLLLPLARDLVASKVDAVVTAGTTAVRAVRDVTNTVPIIMAGAGDPVGTRLIESLARPGGNITGISLIGEELLTKGLSLFKEAAPQVRRVGVLMNAANPANTFLFQKMRASGGVEVQRVDIRDAEELETVIGRLQVEAIFVLADPLFGIHAKRIADLAIRKRLPMAGADSTFTRAGGLISYALDFVDLWRQAAAYVVRVLRGAAPGDLPVEQPTKIELLINLKTAKALGLTIPPSLLARADQVIE
jgi:putative ABC transport system substrate-binding protein